MTIRKKIREKPGTSTSTGTEPAAPGYTAGDEEIEELSPLDIIKQDTDIFSDEAAAVFTLPAPSMEISDYFAYMFIPPEVIKEQSVRSIQ